MVSLMTAEKARAVPTASAGGTLKNSMSTGASSEPAPTPVSPTPAAIRKPTRISVMDHSKFPFGHSSYISADQSSVSMEISYHLVLNLQLIETTQEMDL